MGGFSPQLVISETFISISWNEFLHDRRLAKRTCALTELFEYNVYRDVDSRRIQLSDVSPPTLDGASPFTLTSVLDCTSISPLMAQAHFCATGNDSG